MFGFSFAQEPTPSYNFSPASGTELKLHCNYQGHLFINAGWLNYNAFESTISYDSSNVSLNHVSINSPFTQNQGNSNLWGLYRTYWALPGGQKSSINVNAITFNFKTLNNILGTSFSFTDRLGSTISFGPSTTDDGATLNGFDVNGADILASVHDAIYSFVALPCVPDDTKPTITSFVPVNNSRYVPIDQIISFTTYDWAGAGSVNWPSPLASNNRNHYWYGWLNIDNLDNYVAAPTNVDNQEWVNASSIKVTVACPSCENSEWNMEHILTSTDLAITDWLGDASRNQYTWNSNRRWYEVSFPAPAPYEIEKQVTVTIEVTDNPNENWQTHTQTNTISFNAPQNPTFTRIYPETSEFVSPSKTQSIIVLLADDWAGIDTDSISFTVNAVMSGDETLLPEYVYSGSDLTLFLDSWAEGLWNSGSYLVEFFPKTDFPPNQTIAIAWSASDLAGNIWTFNTSFTTRPDCSFFGCNEILNIKIGLDLLEFTGSNLIITGTNPNSPYPYLTGENNDILYCGHERTWANLTGNVPIYDTDWNQINWVFYNQEALYITGLNFEIIDGVIVVQ